MSRTSVRDAVPPAITGYRFMRHLGAGGNAQVFLYQQDLPHREVAVKVLNESALSEAARGRFTAEANVTAALSHRHIVQVFDAKVTEDGRPYLVMPYYPQPNLSVRARRAHFTVAEVLRIGIQIGGAVETSHRSGVLHRDIKPQNILTDSYGEPALTDFGIATTKGGDGPEGLSVPWSPPEILYGTGPGDERSDVYSLGATLWHLLVGRSPFEQPDGDNKALGLITRIKSDPVPGTGRADVPDSLERLLRQAMAKDPAARPQTAMELIRALQSVEQELRLPVTQPILPFSGPVAEPPGGDTAALPSVPSGETTLSRGHDPARGPLPGRPGRGDAGPPGPRAYAPAAGQAPWGQAAGSSGPGPQGPPRGVAADGADDPTRARGPRHIDPWSPAPGRRGQDGQTGTPAQAAPWDRMADGGSGSRVRQFPPPVPEAATLARPRSVAPGVAAVTGATAAGSRARPGPDSGATEAGRPSGTDGPGRGKGGRALALAGGAAALAVLAGVAVLVLSPGGHPGGTPAGAGVQTQSGGQGNALGLGAPDPPLFNKPKRLSPTRVEFSWTENDSMPGDVFEWQRSPSQGKSWTATTRHEFTVTVAGHHTVCYSVRDTRDGQASDPSAPACWP